MAELNSRTGPRDHLHILRKHVLDPLATAEERTERERADVVRERDAFEAFASRLATIPTVAPASPTLPLGEARTAPSRQTTERLRDAFRETVMSVPHYDDVYGESLEAHACGELGEELSQLFVHDATTPYSDSHEELLTGAANQAAADRDRFRETLDTELDSLRTTYADLEAVLATLDTSIVPAWYRPEFEAEVKSILEARQATLYDRSVPASVDGHTLCDYLYRDYPWTYPGLTAVAQLLDSVVLRDE